MPGFFLHCGVPARVGLYYPCKNRNASDASVTAKRQRGRGYGASRRSHRTVPMTRSPRRPAHDVVAQLARIGEVGHRPAVEVVFGYALLGEALEAVGVAGGLRAEQAIAAGLLGRSPVID